MLGGAAGGQLVQHPSFHPARFRRHKLRLFPSKVSWQAVEIEIFDSLISKLLVIVAYMTYILIMDK
jgi:hypothetical protein